MTVWKAFILVLAGAIGGMEHYAKLRVEGKLPIFFYFRKDDSSPSGNLVVEKLCGYRIF